MLDQAKGSRQKAKVEARCVSARLLLLLGLLALFACNSPEKPAVSLRRPMPIIIISIDTLRSDRLPMYGYRGLETPAFDAFRRDAVLFEHAYSHSPLTLPSHASILTGLLPATHGVRDNVGFRMRAPSAAHLPVILKKRGYQTAGAISAYVLRSTTGIGQGFDRYDDEIDRGIGDQSLGAVQRAGAQTIAAAQQWIASHANKKFFYFLHLYEPHTPYAAPEPFRSRYANAYDAEVAQADALLGGFIGFLKERELYDRALIVVLSDHGEGLGDHEEDEHGIFLYREAIQVPLLIKLPANRLAGQSVTAPVGLIDVTPTILQIAGEKLPHADGRAVLSAKAKLDLPPRGVYSETWYPRLHFGWSELHSLIEGREHYIDAPRAELYDLANDPAERTNVLTERRRRYAAMRAALEPLKKEIEAPSAIDPEEAEKLAALGYIGSASATASGPLPDPKDRTATFRQLREAFRLYRERRDSEALVLFDAVLKDSPDLIDAWDVRSKLLFRMGRTREAIASGKEALRRAPSSTHLAVDLANALLLAGNLDDAERHAQLAVKSEPATAHEILARVALMRGDLRHAEREAQAAIDSTGDSNAALYTMARIEQQKGRYPEVLRLTDDLLARLRRTGGRPLRGLHSLRGDALARAGDASAAEKAFREELRSFPGDAEGYRGLIVLLASQGRTDEATNAIRSFAAAAPNARTYTVIAETLHAIGDEQGAKYWKTRAGDTK